MKRLIVAAALLGSTGASLATALSEEPPMILHRSPNAQSFDEVAALPAKAPFTKRYNKFKYVDRNNVVGWFVRLDGADWVNRDGSGNNFSFLEVPGTPTPGYVWFFDSNRNMQFRIASDGTTAFSYGGEWNPYVTGQWVE